MAARTREGKRKKKWVTKEGATAVNWTAPIHVKKGMRNYSLKSVVDTRLHTLNKQNTELSTEKKKKKYMCTNCAKD